MADTGSPKDLENELARVYTDPDAADRLLDTIDFPRERRPVFKNPRDFWHLIGREIDRGLVDGTAALRAAAAAEFPHNRGFQPDLQDAGDAPPPRLKTWTPPPLPELPYPVLLPYSHPDLLAGRDDDLVGLREHLDEPQNILGLFALSGTGKSSLLLGGLVPALRAAGHPIAVVRHPVEPGVAQHLLAQLLDDDLPVADDERSSFVARLDQVADLAARPPLLILDQFEDVFRHAQARRHLGPLLAATVERRHGNQPRCRWLLGYREECHGQVEAWLKNVLQDADGHVDDLPNDLLTEDRFHALPLKPLGSAPAGRAPAEWATGVFQAVLEHPLTLKDDHGEPIYDWSFAPGHAERLARAFGEARGQRPDAPLTPELQVVLAHLMNTATSRTIAVPEKAGDLVAEALEDHLRRALESTFPTPRDDRRAAGVRTERARALLALNELATREHRRHGLPLATLAAAMTPKNAPADEDAGQQILEQLATPLTRLIVVRKTADGPRYVLSHDRMAEVVEGMVADAQRRGALEIDGDLLALRRVVALRTELYRSHPEQAKALPPDHYQRIAENTKALLLDEKRRKWWTACQRRRSEQRRRRVGMGMVGVLVLAGIVFGIWWGTSRREDRRELLDKVAEGEVRSALEALLQLEAYGDESEVLSQLRQRGHLLERLQEQDSAEAVLWIVTLTLPWVEETPADPVLIARLVWALDFIPARDPTFAEQARELRERVLLPLRRKRPPPEVVPNDWVEIPAGSFQMGSPEHEVTISKFQMLHH